MSNISLLTQKIFQAKWISYGCDRVKRQGKIDYRLIAEFLFVCVCQNGDVVHEQGTSWCACFCRHDETFLVNRHTPPLFSSTDTRCSPYCREFCYLNPVHTRMFSHFFRLSDHDRKLLPKISMFCRSTLWPVFKAWLAIVESLKMAWYSAAFSGGRFVRLLCTETLMRNPWAVWPT